MSNFMRCSALTILLMWAIVSQSALTAHANLVVQRISPKTVRYFSVTPDNRRFVIIRGDDYGRGYGYEVFNAQEGKLLHSASLPEFNWMGMGQTISTDGRYIAYCGDNMHAMAIDTENEYKAIRLTNDPSKKCYNIAVSSQGTFTLFGGDVVEIIRISDAAQPQSVKIISIKESGSIYGSAAISPNGQYIAYSDYYGKLTVYDLQNQREMFSKSSKFLFMGTHSSRLTFLQFSHDSNFVMSQDSGHNVFVHDLNGKVTDKQSVSAMIFRALVDTNGKVAQCPILEFPNAPESRKGQACIPESTSLSVKNASDIATKFSVWGFAQHFKVHEFLKEDIIEKVTTESLTLKPLKPGEPPKTISLLKLKLLRNWAVYAAAYNREYVIVKQSRPPTPGIMVAYKFYALKIVGNEVEILNESADDLLASDFTPTEPGQYAYAWYHALIISSGKSNKDIFVQKPPVANDGYQNLTYSPKRKILLGLANNQILTWTHNGEFLNHAGEAANFREIAFTQNEDMFVTSSEDGTIGIWDVATSAKLATFYGDQQNWVVAARDGRFEYAGTGAQKLHYAKSDEIIELKDFDNSFKRTNLVREILSGFKFKPVIEVTKEPAETEKKNKKNKQPDIKSSLAGKVHSVSEKEALLGGNGFKIGERVYVIHNGKKIRLKVHFPLHTSAKAKTEKASELRLVKKGMPVFR